MGREGTGGGGGWASGRSLRCRSGEGVGRDVVGNVEGWVEDGVHAAGVSVCARACLQQAPNRSGFLRV